MVSFVQKFTSDVNVQVPVLLYFLIASPRLQSLISPWDDVCINVPEIQNTSNYLHCHHLHHSFVFSTWAVICSVASEHHFFVAFARVVKSTGGQLSACVFAATLLSITTTSFCNYKRQCTQARHQVGPGPQSTAPAALSRQSNIFSPLHVEAPG